MSRYRIHFEGKVTAEQIEALNQQYEATIKELVDATDYAQGSFGYDQEAGTFTAHVIGEPVGGDRLDAVRSAFEQLGSELAATDPEVKGSFQYIDAEGVQTEGAFPAPAE